METDLLVKGVCYQFFTEKTVVLYKIKRECYSVITRRRVIKINTFFNALVAFSLSEFAFAEVFVVFSCTFPRRPCIALYACLVLRSPENVMTRQNSCLFCACSAGYVHDTLMIQLSFALTSTVWFFKCS